MKFKQALAIVKSLAASQGFYGRVLETMEGLSDKEIQMFEKEIKDCKDELDLVMHFEG